VSLRQKAFRIFGQSRAGRKNRHIAPICPAAGLHLPNARFDTASRMSRTAIHTPAIHRPNSPRPGPEQQLAMFRIYAGYRILLYALLAGLILFSWREPLLGGDSPLLFLWTSSLYAGALALMLLAMPRRNATRNRVILANLLADIAILTLLAHWSGGSSSGLALLLLVDVAVSGLMLSGQLAALIAALATIALLADTIYLSLHRPQNQNFLTTGMLGMLCFATAWGFHRLRNSQLLAQSRSADISKLQNLNQLIVQRMRTGILVVDHDMRVLMMNQAATDMLQAPSLERRTDLGERPELPEPLRGKLQRWLVNPDMRQKPFSTSAGGAELVARFTQLRGSDSYSSGTQPETLIFLEDNLQLAQRAQQLKLAALGRLTASIAHEIRNPLGAISHAAQLLRESEELAPTDQRLTDIIQKHSQRMNTVIENVLQLSRRSPPNPQRLDLQLWLTDLVQQFRQGHPNDCHIDIHVDGDIDITIDPNQLGQVLTNLLENALRYSPRTPNVAQVHLAGSINDNGLPQLDIIDSGPGIPDELRERVFEPFFTTESDGNGLGLYIARELCEFNQARLHYLRLAQGESCFRINFAHPDRRPLINE
jgi:two-component system sensor histidine kinase PilS (NtrC family)